VRCKEFHTTPRGCCVDSKNLSKTLCATCLFFVLPLEVPGINTSAACDTALIGGDSTEDEALFDIEIL